MLLLPFFSYFMLIFSPKLFIRDRWVYVPLALVFFVQGFCWWYTVVHVRPTNEQIFLHYTIVFGVDLVGEWWKMYIIPFSGLLTLIVNSLVAFFMYGSEKVMARMLLAYTVLVQIFILIGLLKIIGLTI